MSVPAWPMPIHQTKLTMANPQATGTFTPQTPTPTASSTTSEYSSTSISTSEMPKPIIQPRPVCLVRTIPLIFSVTEV